MKRELRNSLKSFLTELLVYAAVVVAYFFLVLHLLGPSLAALFHAHRRWYACLALALIIGQGVMLELLTRSLMNFIKPRTDD